MTEYTLNLTILGKDKVSGMFNRVDGSLRSIMNTALGFVVARIFEDIAEGVARVGAAALNAVAYVQILQLTLGALAARELVMMSNGTLNVEQAMGQASTKASALVQELGKLAILSPYTLEATTNTYRMMVAFGSTTDQAMQLTKGLLTMGAGLGASNEQIQRMAYNLAQIAIQGKVTALDVRQLALAGLPLNDVLETMGRKFGLVIKDNKDFNEAWQAGKFTWQDFVNTFQQYADENFGKSAERMARSLYGLKSTFNDVFALTMPRVLGPAVDQVTAILSRLLDSFLFIYENPELKAIGLRLGETVKGWVAPLMKVMDELMMNLESGWDITISFKRMFGKLGALFRTWIGNAITAMLESIPGIVAAGSELATKLMFGIATKIPMLGTLAVQIVTGLAAALVTQTPALINATGAMWMSFGTEILKLLPVLVSSFMQLFGALAAGAVQWIGPLSEMVVSLVTMIAQLIVSNLPILLAVGVQILAALITGMLSAVSGIANVLAPLILTLVNGLVNITPTIVSALQNIILALMTTLTPLLGEIIPAVISAIATSLPRLLSAGLMIITALVNAIITALPILISYLPNLITTIINTIVSVLPTLLTLGTNIITTLINAIITALPMLLDGAVQIIDALLNAILTNLPLIVQMGVDVLLALINGILQAIPMLLGMLPTLITSLITVIANNLPLLLSAGVQILMALINGIVQAIPMIIEILPQVILAIINALVGALPQLVALVPLVIVEVINALLAALPQLLMAVMTLIPLIIQALIENLPLLITAGSEIIVALMNGFAAAVPMIIQTIVTLLMMVVNLFLDYGPKVYATGITMLGNLTLAIKDMIPKALEKSKEMFDKMLTAWENVRDKFANIGKEVIEGLKAGISEKWDALKEWFNGLIDGLSDTVKKLLGIESPSKVFMGIGANISRGLALGIKRTALLPEQALNYTFDRYANTSMQRPMVTTPNVTTTTTINTQGATAEEIIQAMEKERLLNSLSGRYVGV